ncbi:MAG: 2TM domain-containing protein [Pricia sp.]
MESKQKENKYLRAKERVEEVRNFYSGIISALFTVGLLAGINYYIDQWSYPWFLWAAFGFSVSLIFKAIRTFKFNPYFGKGWEERKIKQFMQEDERRTR